MDDRSAVVARWVAVVAAAAVAVMYALIGFGMLFIGESGSGDPADLLAFGLLMGGIFAVVSIALAVVRSRLLYVGVGLLQIVVIAGYFGLAEVRTPPFEIWGLLVKACQTVVLVAVTYLALRGGRVAHKVAPTT